MTPEIKSNIAIVVSGAALLWTITRDLIAFFRDRGSLKLDAHINLFDKTADGYTPKKAKTNSKLSVVVSNIGKRPITIREFQFYRKKWFRYKDLGAITGNPEGTDKYLPITLNEGQEKTFSMALSFAYQESVSHVGFLDQRGKVWMVEVKRLLDTLVQDIKDGNCDFDLETLFR